MIYYSPTIDITYTTTYRSTTCDVTYELRTTYRETPQYSAEQERKIMEALYKQMAYESRIALKNLPDPLPARYNVRPTSKAIRWQQLSQRTR